MTDFLIRQFIKKQAKNPEQERARFGILAPVVGIICNFLLFLLKFFVGSLVKSISITADAFNNLTDTASSIITLLGFKMANKPPDEDHPFGHGRLEYFSGLLVSLLVLWVGIQFLISSAQRIIHPEPQAFAWIPILLVGVSILVKIWLAAFNNNIGQRIDSSALKASAMDAKSDVLISLTVVVGLIVGHLTGLSIDGFLGIFVALMILKNAWELIKETLDPLLGGAPDPALLSKMESILMDNSEVYGVHDMVAHNYGPTATMASCHVAVRDNISIVEIHDIIDDLEKKIKKELGVEMIIHMDPIHVTNQQDAQTIAKLEEALKEIPGVASLHDLRLRQEIFYGDLVVSTEVEAEPIVQKALEIIANHGYRGNIIVERQNIYGQ